MIEQLGMAGRLPGEAEVIDGSHQSAAEQPVPNAVGRDARGQRIARRGNPVRERHARVRIVGFDVRGESAFLGDDGEHAGRNDEDGPVEFPALEHMGVEPLAARLHAHGEAERAALAVVGLERVPRLVTLRAGAAEHGSGDAVSLANFAHDVGHFLFGGLLPGPECVQFLMGEGFASGWEAHACDIEQRGELPRLRLDQPVVRRGVSKNGRQSVVVGLRDRIGLVIVAARAGGGQAEKGARGGIDLLIDQVGEEFPLVHLADQFLADGEEARGNEILRPLAIIGDGQGVARELLADEAVEGLVLVEAVDHVVAVTPGVREDAVGIPSGGVGVAGDVEPMAAPVLAEAWRTKKGIHQLRDGFRLSIHLFGPVRQRLRRGRQATQREAESANQDGRRSRR